MNVYNLANFLPISDPFSLILHLWGNKNLLRIPPRENENIQRALRLLDKIEPVEFHAVGVLYIGESQNTETEILANQYGSDRYSTFIRL